MRIYEQFRPKDWAEVVGQDKAIEKIRAVGDPAGECFWISGASGTGKTTIARLIAGCVALPFYTHEPDGQCLTISDLKRIEDTWRYSAMGSKRGHALIVNEAHGLTSSVARYLLTMLERQPEYVTVVFTTTNDGQDMLFERTDDAGPLLSRCHHIQLARRDLCAVFAARAREIAEAIGKNGRPIEEYVKLVRAKNNNMRAVLQAVSEGCML